MKPIFLKDDEKQKLIQEFTEALNKQSMLDGEFSFNRKYTMKNEEKVRALIVFTASAFTKMMMLVQSFDSEVAWHYLTRRGTDPATFEVYDVLVYPQVVTGATVNTDDESYTKFMMDLTDEQAEFMHGQGHSHVNMATSPSSVDKQHQYSIIQTMGGQGFYLFQIWNKRLESTSILYDFDNNVLYEDKDIDVDIVDEDGLPISWFISDAKDHVVKKTAVTSNYPTSNYLPKETKKEKKEKEASKPVAAYDPYEDDEDWEDMRKYYESKGYYWGGY